MYSMKTYLFIVAMASFAVAGCGGDSEQNQEVRSYRINDTGYSRCGNFVLSDQSGTRTIQTSVTTGRQHSNQVDCINGETGPDGTALPETAAQDAFAGRDFQAATGELQKQGHGIAGFDFTKLDADGDTLPRSASSWSCIRDNHTGLIWESKSAEPRLYHSGDTFTYRNSNLQSNGGATGPVGDGEQGTCFGFNSEDPSSYCTSEAFVARVNQQALCGIDTWRLPSREELIGIVVYLVQPGEPHIDSEFFPETQIGAFQYLTASPTSFDTQQVWVVDFETALTATLLKQQLAFIRLVS